MRASAVVALGLAFVLLSLAGAQGEIAPARLSPLPHAAPAKTAATHPCYPIDPNGSVCIQVDVGNYSNPGVLPTPGSGALNASWAESPVADEDLHFQVLSTNDIANCSVYDPPSSLGACTSAYDGPEGMYTGEDAYLYLSVDDVLWQGVCWFCAADGTTWHANTGLTWSPQQGHPYTGDPVHHWVYDLNISAYGPTGEENFPNGSWVLWNITWDQWVYSPTSGFGLQTFCAPACGGLLDADPEMFSYFTKNAWYYNNEPAGASPPYGVGDSNQAPSSAAGSSFDANLNLSYGPLLAGGPPAPIYLKTANIENLSNGRINVDASLVDLQAWYPNGTFWRTWVSGWTALGTAANATSDAEVLIPSPFLDSVGTRLQWYVQAYDQYGHLVQSANVSQVVASTPCLPGNFSSCFSVSTPGNNIASEGPTGWLPTSPPSLPSLGPYQPVNVTVVGILPTTALTSGMVVENSTVASGGVTTRSSTTSPLLSISSGETYDLLPALPSGSNATLVIQAENASGDVFRSQTYRFVVDGLEVPGAYCFFYVAVTDQGSVGPAAGANITITGLAGTIRIDTTTSNLGVAYPDLPGQPWAPRYLPANDTYQVSAQIPGFTNVDDDPPSDQVTASLLCQHQMTRTDVLLEGPSFEVVLAGDVVEFEVVIGSSLESVSVSPASAQVDVGGRLQLTGSASCGPSPCLVLNDDEVVSWALSSPALGTIVPSSAGSISVTFSAWNSTGEVTLTLEVSINGISREANATISVVHSPSTTNFFGLPTATADLLLVALGVVVVAAVLLLLVVRRRKRGVAPGTAGEPVGGHQGGTADGPSAPEPPPVVLP